MDWLYWGFVIGAGGISIGGICVTVAAGWAMHVSMRDRFKD